MSAENTRDEATQGETNDSGEAAMGPPKEIPPPKSNIEKEQEAKLRAKYPGLKGPGSNPLLQKRLNKGPKYFDSGDYNMAKAGIGGKKTLPTAQKLLLMGAETGSAHPTPETIPARKTSLVPTSQHLSSS